jgi:anaerobic selenocysteine-containing dehydrogenase
VENIESIANLALMGGMIGKQGAGLLPLRGHSNVQGVGSVGVVPELKAAVLKNIETHLGIPIPKSKGLDTLACVQAAYHNKMDFALLLGGNLFAASPDPHFTEAALNKIAFKVHLHPTLNKGHVYASDGEVLILPIAVRDEEKQATTQESMFNYVRISDGGIKRFPKLRSEADIITQLASQLIPKRVFDFSIFSHYANIRTAIAKTIPGFEAIRQADKDRTEFQVQGRTLHNTQFPTPSGKAQFQVIAIPATQPNKQHIYQMSTIRSEGQFNTIIYEEEDIYRKQTERWVVFMNAQDMRREGLG